MPDLVGVCGSTANPGIRSSVLRMAERVEGNWADRVVLDRPWISLAAFRFYGHDPLSWIIDEESPRSIVALGPSPALVATFDDSADGDLEKLLHEIDPPFALCVVDGPRRSLQLVSDPYGLWPIYYARVGDSLIFGTKLNTLLAAEELSPELDRSAVLDFFTFEHVTGDRTFLKGVTVLPPGVILEFAMGRHSLRTYRRLPEIDPRLTAATIADRLHDGLVNAISRISSFESRRVAVTLSGGLDSRAILGCSTPHTGQLSTFTMGTTSADDVLVARCLSDRCSVRHHVLELDGSHLVDVIEHGVYITGGMVSCVHYTIMALLNQLVTESDVVLDGLGGDALTGGHLKWGMIRSRDAQRVAGLVYRERATACATERDRQEIFEPDFLAGLEHDPFQSVARYFRSPNRRAPWISAHEFDIRERQRRFIQYGPHLLRGSIDVQTPFYASGVAELLLAAPVSALLEQRAYLQMHRKHLGMLARVPDALRRIPVSSTLGARFTKKVLDYAWRRFVPDQAGPLRNPTDYGTWFRTILSEHVRERLLDSKTPFEGIVQRGFIEGLIRSHSAQEADHTSLIGCLLTFAEWARSCAAGKSPYRVEP